MLDLTRLCRILALFAALTAYAFAVAPAGSTPELSSWDKANHFAAFFTIALLARPAYRLTPWWVLAAILAGFGGFIEICQMIPALHRDASFADWIADIVAILAGLSVASLLLAVVDRFRAADQALGCCQPNAEAGSTERVSSSTRSA